MNVPVFALVCSQNPQECLRAMKSLLCQLPKPNYATLKFIIAFLVLITQQEAVNKMNAMALAIVFGSVLFRFVILCCLLDTVNGTIIYILKSEVSVFATVSARINPLPSNRVRCCNPVSAVVGS